MTELLTSAQMRAIEQAAIRSGAVTGLELMERAGRGLVEAVFREWPVLMQGLHRAVVLCGPGNNGGDGFVIARLLKEWGWEVEVYLYGDPARLPADARANYDRWCAMGAVAPLPRACADPGKADLVVDALFGTGLGRCLSKDLVASALSFLPARDAGLAGGAPHVVAVDMPSGLSSDTGAVLPVALPADLTVTFHAEKLGHRLGHGPEACNRLVCVSIGLEGTRAAPQEGPAGAVVELVAPPFPALRKAANAHKYSHGHAVVLSGPMGRSGAARLAARGALRIGAGLVTVAAPGSAMMECAAQLTAIMLRRCDDGAGLAELLDDSRLNAMCMGPGMGGRDESRDLVEVGLKSGRACVLDADALTLIARDSALFAALHPACVLTPHAGEFARLFPDLAAQMKAAPEDGAACSKVDATRAAAQRAGCVVLFKGPDTVIAAPDGRCTVHAAAYERAAPWLATAGAGDVLAGFIAGLLARGLAPMQAAEAAAWLHVEAARAFGPGMIAEDLPEALPGVLHKAGA